MKSPQVLNKEIIMIIGLRRPLIHNTSTKLKTFWMVLKEIKRLSLLGIENA